MVDDSGRGTLQATTTLGSTVAIGDAVIPAGKVTALLPASYTVTAAPTALLSGETSTTVLPGAATDVSLDAEIRPEATAAAQKQLDEHLKTCTEPAAKPPSGCGIRIPWGTEFSAVTDIRYRIEQLPVVTLSASGFNAEGGILVATVTGTGQDGAARTTTYRTESWSVRGTVSFTADGMELTAR